MKTLAFLLKLMLTTELIALGAFGHRAWQDLSGLRFRLGSDGAEIVVLETGAAYPHRG